MLACDGDADVESMEIGCVETGGGAEDEPIWMSSPADDTPDCVPIVQE